MGAFIQRESLPLTELAVLVSLLAQEVPIYLGADSTRLRAVCRTIRALSEKDPIVIVSGPAVVSVEYCSRFRFNESIQTGRGFCFNYSSRTSNTLPVHLVRQSESTKGISVHATRVIYPEEVCARYCGEMISSAEADRRRQLYIETGQVSTKRAT